MLNYFLQCIYQETFVPTNDLIRLSEVSVISMKIHISTNTHMLVLKYNNMPRIFCQNNLIPTAEAII